MPSESGYVVHRTPLSLRRHADERPLFGRALLGKTRFHPERIKATAERNRKPALSVVEGTSCAEIAFSSDSLLTQVDVVVEADSDATLKQPDEDSKKK